MSENTYKIGEVQKKFKDLDSDLNSFMQSIKEIKEIRDSVRSLPDQLKQGEESIAHQRRDLDTLMSSTNNLLMTFEEQAKGILFDLEKKTDALTGEAKKSIVQISTIFQQSTTQLKDHYTEQSETNARKYEDIKESLEVLKNVVGVQQQAINSISNHFTASSGIFDTLEPSLVEMKKSIYALQNHPNKSEVMMKKMEKRLENLIHEKNAGQKMLSWSIVVIFLTGFLYFLFAIYLQ